MHPFHVALILDRHGYSENVVMAGVLHDVLEDTDYPAAELEAEFGAEVIRLVKSVTELKTEGGVKRLWRVRKEEQLEHLRHARPDEAALKAADALHNVRSILNDLRTQGAETMSRFNAGAEEQVWYVGSVAAIVCDRLGEANSLAAELKEAVSEFRQLLAHCECADSG